MKLIFVFGSTAARSSFRSLLTTRLDIEGVNHRTFASSSEATLSDVIHARRSADAPAVGIVEQTGVLDFDSFVRHFPNGVIAVRADELSSDNHTLLLINTEILGQLAIN